MEEEKSKGSFQSKYKNNKFKNNADYSEESSDRRMRQSLADDKIDERFEFTRVSDFNERVGFMVNMHAVEILDENKRLVSGVDFYFLEEDGRRFKATVTYAPYFYVLVKQESMRDLSSFLKKKYDGVVSQIDVVTKEDLDLPNHLIGLKQRYLKLSFPSMTELMKARKDILTVVRKNKQKSKSKTIYAQMMSDVLNAGRENDKHYTDQMDNILDIREYDVPYHARVCIDLKLFAGLWYSVQGRGRDPPILTRRTDLIETPDLIVLAFDIECTKQPLKFPDAASDMIMMISYMVDGQGYLINNRQVISADVDDFEYTPYPEFEGNFIVMNEPDEKAVLEKFFEHIADVKPHVIATYNGDNFDWPFVEQRAAVHNLTMALDIGFTSKDGVYASRPIIHMDCLCWVKRDSYLPVGSQNLKAVAKAKLRYDPVEIDPEDMCAMAAEEPQTMCNYSVSDAVATYYLYMKYVHPFIFALCTILPMEPDEALRKGSGTLCELLLMVEAFDANIIFPNKQEQELNKTTADGHILDSETYVGGHVEAIESGVFRADIPCRFKLDPDGLNKLKENVRKALVHAIEEEEKVPVDNVVKLDEVVLEIQQKLEILQNEPMTSAPPVILHLDVGAMYPNIILTNRLQPSAIVNEETCAACDFNRPGAKCQRKMNWTWRGERMPASRNEFLSIQQQLETEKFPPQFPGGPPRAFHQLSREEAANVEKVRLQAYCRRAYKKTRETKTEVRTSTICQMENSFYVDTVRAFRDRRYEYKGLCKDAKKAVVAAVAGGDAREIKSAKNREVLYDSLQLAHKCILNSFYGYVMRRGARWYSMEMAGIVCQTGAGIIMKACKLIEQIGRPLELDTDGIWCILPDTFPQDYTINTTHEKKKTLTISYPNAILNCMVKEHFTNDQYHELVDSKTLKYEQRSENTIFFEVDGPYLAMVLPASKEKGKKLKKRYAVFNFDKSLAELKGFEVKRRGELQLIKNFQSSVFECFLQGDTLQKCYEAVAKVADYWLDVLYSKASNMPDSELFELISEKKSMSKKLEEYGAQKSTSISTAKRLAEFLGDQMVKDKGLACRFVISRKPEGAPVTERAIPLAIFQSEPSVRRHFLRKWLKDSSLTDPDIRQVLDWNYYIERLNGTIQKIITIPAALQSVANPVPRVKHPDWLHKEMLEKNDVLKQRRMNDFFKPTARPVVGVQSAQVMDVEDAAGSAVRGGAWPRPVVVSRKRKRGESAYTESELAMSWREALGPAPPIGTTRDEHVEWLKYQKKKWALQLAQRRQRTGEGPRKKSAAVERNVATMGGFIKKTQRAILDYSWQVIQFVETNDPGVFRVWALVNKELHCIKLNVPRVFYVNKRTPRPEDEVSGICRKSHRHLPRSRRSYNLYEYTVPERDFQQERESFLADLSTTDVEGIYETEMPLEFRLLITLGCRCEVEKETSQRLVREGMRDTDTFSMCDLNYCKLTHEHTYLADLPGGELPFKHIFLYQHHSQNAQRSIYALFLTPSNKAAVFVLDTVISKTFPNASQIYTAERNELLQEIANANDVSIPEEDIEFDVQHFSDSKLLYRAMQRALQKYRDEKRGATIVISQTAIDSASLVASMPELVNFPVVALHRPDSATLYSTMEWQKVGARALMRNYLRAPFVLADVIAQCRYLNIPIGNLRADPAVFGADVLYARHLMKNNLVLWCSPSPLPDLGGRQADDGRLLSEMDDVLGTSVINNQGAYSTICVELDIDTLAVNTLLQSHHVQDIEGANANLALDAAPTVRVDDSGSAVVSEGCDDSALSGEAFRVLRATVAACLKDVASQQNAYADQIVTHFYRWLRHPNALLYEPVLFRTLHSLMKKLFIQLVAEFRRLGSVVVHADFSKIVICTRKLTATDADCCVQYILASIQNKELFHGIHITPSSSWEYLLWMNPANYGGIKLDTGSETSELSEGSNVNVNMNWSLAERLPMESHVRELFNGLIMRYIGFVWCKLREERSQVAAASPQRRSTPGMFSQVPPTPMGVGVDDSLKSITVDYITGDMSQRMFDLVQKIHKRLPSVKCTAIGMNGEVITPALEFAKAVTKVLELDKSIAEPVTRLRRNMLKLLGVGEFSREADWKEPCVPAILPEVICANCNHCRDLDLCNDPHITSVDERPGWSCSVCESSYDMNEIEFQLMENVQKKIISYTLQDLQCAKCRQIQADNLTQYCTCAGNFNTLISTDALRAYLATIESVCEHYQLQLLKESIVWMRTSMRL